MHHRSILAASILVLATAASSAPAWAGWGCAYDSSAGVGRRWGYATEQEARNTTMEACTSRQFAGCRIIGCSNDVDTKEDADKLWSRTPGISYEGCGKPGQRKC